MYLSEMAAKEVSANRVHVATCRNGDINEITGLQTLENLLEIQEFYGKLAERLTVIKWVVQDNTLCIYVNGKH